MIESTALDFWRKSKKPEIESYIIDHDFRKIQVKNTGSYWILPYIYRFELLIFIIDTKLQIVSWGCPQSSDFINKKVILVWY